MEEPVTVPRKPMFLVAAVLARKRQSSAIVLALLFLVVATTSTALPIISVDLDPVAIGIQTTRIVDPGEIFTIDIVYTGDGAAAFDTFGFDVFFNDMGAGVLGLSGGTGMPTLGSVSSTAPILALGPLSLGTVGFPLTGTFTAQSGGIGGISFGGLPFGFPIPFPAIPIDLFSLALVGGTPGMSTVAPSAGFAGGLAFDPDGPDPLPPVFVETALASGTVTVSPVPEPGTWLIMGTGIVGLAGTACRRRKRLSVGRRGVHYSKEKRAGGVS